MVIVMKSDATKEQIEAVVEHLKRYGIGADVSEGKFRTIIGMIGDETKIDSDRLRMIPGVDRILTVMPSYKLVSREYIPEDRVVDVRGVKIGGDNEPVFIAGPCAIESRDQIRRIAKEVKEAGAKILRGGAYKPRSSVHSFQGLGEEGLQHLTEAGEEFGLAIVTEVLGPEYVDIVGQYADMYQIGMRNMRNFDLLKEIGKRDKPVLLKRGDSSTVEEFLKAAEYIVAEGNKNIVLCERGIRTFETATRNTLDLSAVPVVRGESYLPITVDPSHATGHRGLIYDMSKAAIAAGAHGLIIEVHYNPTEALSDGPQMVTPEEFKRIVRVCREIYSLNRKSY